MPKLKVGSRVLVRGVGVGTVESSHYVNYDSWDGDEPGVFYQVRLDEPVVPKSGVPWSVALFSRKDLTPQGRAPEM